MPGSASSRTTTSSGTSGARDERRRAAGGHRRLRHDQTSAARFVICRNHALPRRGRTPPSSDRRARSESAAKARLRERLVDRPPYRTGGLLDLSSSFGELAALWREDLELQKLSDGTKENYRDDLRLRVMPQFAHFALGEITTGRIEWFLRSEAAAFYSRAKHSRTMLNLLFGFVPALSIGSYAYPRVREGASTAWSTSAIRAAPVMAITSVSSSLRIR